MTSYKPIKFFLRIGDELIQNLEDLYNNFHIDKIYKLYQEGILQRWLTVHGIEDKAHSLLEFDKIYHKDDIDEVRAKEFCNIFFTESHPDIEYIIQNFKLNEKWKTESELINNKQGDYATHIKAYHHGYEELKNLIVKDALNMPAIRVHIEDLICNYFELFKLDCSTCLDRFADEAPAALLILFANEIIRDFISTCPQARETALNFIKDNTPLTPEDLGEKKLAPFIFPKESEVKNVISCIKTCSESTYGDWKEIEPDKNKRFMILYNNTVLSKLSIRPYNDPGKELPEEIIDLPIIHGIEYRNYQMPKSYLLYMEV
ncbi:MAG: hypothetical protein K6E31_00950 [bacterium]|nr:hypothetical protein [bacterium]